MEFLTNVIVGVLTGAFSSWLVTKYARFSSLRSEALRIIKRIDYVWEVKPRFSNHERATSNLHAIASDLLYLGHKRAGEDLLRINQELSLALQEAQGGAISYEAFDKRYGTLQSSIRQLLPTPRALFWGFAV